MIFRVETENQLEKTIRIFRTDGGGEYNSYAMSQFCKENGIIHESITPYTRESNEVTERKNRIIISW